MKKLNSGVGCRVIVQEFVGLHQMLNSSTADALITITMPVSDQAICDLEAQAYTAMRKKCEMQRWRWALRGIVIQ
jgi:hypothetical protein